MRDYIEDFIELSLPIFEYRVIVLAIMVFFIILILSCMVFMLIYAHKKYKGTLTGTFSKKKKFILFIKRYVYILPIVFIAFPLILFSIFLVESIFFTKPNVINSTPEHESIMSSEIPNYKIEFDLPIDQENFEVNLSPEINGEWEFEYIWGRPSLVRKATYIPTESVKAGEPGVMYITGIRSWMDDEGKLHEQAIEFQTPTIPNVESTIPEIDSTDFAPDKNLLIEFDAEFGDFVSFFYEISPSVEFEAFKKDSTTIEIDFVENLPQDQKYSLLVFRETRTYNLETKEDIKKSDTEEIYKLNFTTVSTPLLESYSPKGSAVNSESPIKAVFDQQMNKEDVEANFKIEPAVEGIISWEDERTFVYTPTTALPMDTKYSVTFTKGIRSEVFGETEEDIVFSFETAGNVLVTNFTPVSGTTGHPTSLTVSTVFDQEIDHASAQSKFSISPAIAGTFTWDGNTMLYTVSGLEYYTDYKVNIATGVKSVYGLDSNQAFSTVFGTKSNLTTINFPWYQQQEGFTCNIAATRMSLAYYGIYLSEAQIKNGVGYSNNPNVGWVSGYGVHVGPVASFVSGYRPVETKTNWNASGVAHEIEAGNPVILWWYNRYSQPFGSFTLPSGVTGYNGMHSEVVYGFRGSADNPTAILVRDPWRGHLEYTTANFMSNWAYLNRTALVVR